MNLSDYIIIYLAGGAPFAVYFYLQNRQRLFLRQLILKTVLNLIFWIPLSVRFLLKRLARRNANAPHQTELYGIEKEIGERQRLLDKIAGENFSGIEFYQLKEISARYAGLSLALLDGERDGGEPSESIFQFSEYENHELGSICLQRRSRQKLAHHQKLAGQDFVDAIIRISVKIEHLTSVERLALELSEILQDESVNKKLTQHFRRGKQTAQKAADESAEKFLWKTSPSKLTNPESIPVNLTAFKQTARNFKD